MVLNVILAILVLSIIVIVHEFGHFIIAKANGITVVEFSIGFGPKLIHFRKGETEYCIKALPFGGACTMLGDEFLEMSVIQSEEDNDEELTDEEKEAKKRKLAIENGYDMEKSFASKSVWARIAVIAAGPVFNFLLAFVCAVVIVGSLGYDPCDIDVVKDNSPATEAGLQEGDVITKVNGHKVTFYRDFYFYRAYNADKTLNITFTRDGEKMTTTVTPQHIKQQKYQVGIMMNENCLISSVTKDSPAEKAGLKANDVIKAVDGYADLLRISVASAGNDHRLGANEAPPAVVSIFLGDELTEVLKAIENDEFFAGHGAVQMDIGAKVLPHFVKDNTDRNRTSPFAFTGNKFEFRMLGSSSSVANPNIILNTAVAEVLHQFYEELKDVPAENMDTAVHELLKKTIIDHKRVIFNGNGYTDEWIEEAEKRGLYNLVSTPDALPHFIDEKNEKLLTSHHIFTDAELHSRYEIKLDNYVKTLHIEAGTLAEIIQKDLLPSITTYMEKIAQTAALKKSVVPDISVSAEASLLTQLTELSEAMTKDLETLKKDTAMAEYEAGKDLLKSAKLYQSVVLSDMEKVRASADAAEVLIPDSILPYPTYGKLLFSISD